ncbi:glycosyltransferase family 4 protein [bacterium]|nr:glycosyltransferase family 4 protein [bacterium]
MDKLPLKIHVISQVRLDRIAGGAEFFISQLPKFFSEVEYTFPSKESGSSAEYLRAKEAWNIFYGRKENMDCDAILTLGLGGWAAPKNLPIPRINVFQGNWFGFRDHCYHPLQKSWWAITLRKIRYEKLSGRNAINIAPSHFIGAILKKEGMDNINVVHNAPNVKTVAKPESAEKKVIFVGRATREKGFGIFIKTAMLNPDIQFTAVLFGKNTVKNLPKNIQLLHDLPHYEMGEIYSQADVLLFPSRFEGNSYTVLEAFASGLPVIGTPVGLFPELRDFPGIMVNKWKAQRFSSALKEVRREEYSPADFLQMNFSPETVKAEWGNALRDLL